MSSDETSTPPPDKQARPHPVLRIVLPILIVAFSILIAVILVRTAPEPTKRPPGERVSIVDILKLTKSKDRIVLRTTGTVIPRRTVILQPRVSGPVVAVAPHFIPGGRFLAGEVVLEIERADYALAVTNRRAALAKAQFDLAVERGMQDVARHEWEAMQRLNEKRTFTDADRELALREPHLHLAQGNMASAQALFAQAMLDLDRTSVRAPFNSLVRERYVNIGSQVSIQTSLAELVDTDAYWVRITLPAGQTRWVSVGDQDGRPGAKVAISSVPGIDLQGVWHGTVLRQLPDLEPAGRQAVFLVEVPNPDKPAEGAGTLALGAYVRAAIEGPEIEGLFSIPRRALRDESTVWLMNAESRLDIRPVDILWKDDTRALVRNGLSEGEDLVLSDIVTPLKGMLLTTVAAVNERRRAAEAKPASGAIGSPGR